MTLTTWLSTNFTPEAYLVGSPQCSRFSEGLPQTTQKLFRGMVAPATLSASEPIAPPAVVTMTTSGAERPPTTPSIAATTPIRAEARRVPARPIGLTPPDVPGETDFLRSGMR